MNEPRVPHETERITIGLIPKASAARDHLRARTKLSQTDIVNRAIQLYDFVDERIQAGDSIVVRHPDGTTELINLF